jgi:hypothetical protein
MNSSIYLFKCVILIFFLIRLDTISGKFPLHLTTSLALSALEENERSHKKNHTDKDTEEQNETQHLEQMQFAFLHQCLLSYPEAIFEKISEEINSLRLVSREETETSLENNDDNRRQSVTTRRNSDDFDTVVIGGDQYKIETTVHLWSPYDRVMASDKQQVRKPIFCYFPLFDFKKYLFL